MSTNIKLTVAYDGSHFLGWQKTKEGSSIEETLQTTLEQIFQEPMCLQAASRTDAGVHAVGQVINFFTSKSSLDLEKLCKSLNGLLPKEIAVLHAEIMPFAFHPTLDCICKEYHYWVCNGHAQLPMLRFYSWHYPHALNLEKMSRAAQYLTGVHDFQAFCNSLKNATYENYKREITSLEICQHPDKRLQFIIKGPNFLYKMIRNIVGTLVYVGVGKINADEVPSIIVGGDRTKAGITAPAHGLTLYRAFF